MRSAKQLLWRHPDSPTEIPFATTNAVRAKLSAVTNYPVGLLPHSITLSNGDILHGVLTSLDADRAVVETPYAGTVTLQRSMLRSIVLQSAGGSVIYDGPGDLDGWTINSTVREAWTYRDGSWAALRPGAMIGKRLALPNAFEIDLTCRGSVFVRFRLDFLSTRTDVSNPLGFSLEMNGSQIKLIRNETGGARRQIGSTPSYRAERNAPLRFRLFVDQAQSEMHLFVNDDYTHTWKNIGSAPADGNAVTLRVDQQGLTLNRLRITGWSGQLPDLATRENDADYDLVRLANGDLAAGNMDRITDGLARIRTNFTSVSTPLDRILRIDFKRNGMRRARFFEDDVRLYYPASGYLTLRIETLKDGLLTGTSENLGRISLPQALFRSIRFDIYRDFEHPELEGLLF